jgi:hypothetical protein
MGNGGIRILQQAASQLSSLMSVAITKSNTSNTFVPGDASNGPYRPVGWANDDPTGQKARYSLSYTLPPIESDTNSLSSATIDSNGNAYYTATPSATPKPSYAVFDAVIKATFNSRLRITDYPVQTGQNFTYNAVLEPVRLMMEVGVYDTVDTYAAGMWGNDSNKSVAALKLMQRLQQLRLPITINSRWGSYYPLLLEDITLPDDNATFAAAKMTLIFRQVFVSQLAAVGQSSRNQTTDTTNSGNVSSTAVPETVTNNNTLNAAQQANVVSKQVKTNNAGIVSSNPTSKIPSLPLDFLPN